MADGAWTWAAGPLAGIVIWALNWLAGRRSAREKLILDLEDRVERLLEDKEAWLDAREDRLSKEE